MAQIHKRDLGGIVSIGEDKYRWELYREPCFSDQDGYKGVCISVFSEDLPRRELLLEFPYVHSLARIHRRPKPSDNELIKHIKAAIADGWDPASRGRAFAFQISDDKSA